MGKVRIIGGIYRSRILKFDDGVGDLRPTPDRVRETLFNWLGQDLTDKRCLDLFAGSGVLGFEALSRNARQVVFVENNKLAANRLRQNGKLLEINNLEIVFESACHYLKQCLHKFDIVFLDPPYNSELLTQSLELIKKYSILSAHGMVYVEYKTAPDLSGYIVNRCKKAGMVNYALIELSAAN